MTLYVAAALACVALATIATLPLHGTAALIAFVALTAVFSVAAAVLGDRVRRELGR